MNANELADELEAASSDMEYNYHVSDWKLLYECALVMRKQSDRIGVLEANHKIQINIVEKQQDYIDQLEQGLQASIDLNKALVQRKEKCPPSSWWKGDPTCGGLTENYGLGKAQEK